MIDGIGFIIFAILIFSVELIDFIIDWNKYGKNFKTKTPKPKIPPTPRPGCKRCQ